MPHHQNILRRYLKKEWREMKKERMVVYSTEDLHAHSLTRMFHHSTAPHPYIYYCYYCYYPPARPRSPCPSCTAPPTLPLNGGICTSQGNLLGVRATQIKKQSCFKSVLQIASHLPSAQYHFVAETCMRKVAFESSKTPFPDGSNSNVGSRLRWPYSFTSGSKSTYVATIKQFGQTDKYDDGVGDGVGGLVW